MKIIAQCLVLVIDTSYKFLNKAWSLSSNSKCFHLKHETSVINVAICGKMDNATFNNHILSITNMKLVLVVAYGVYFS